MPTKRTIQQLYDFFAPGQSDGSITPDRVQDLILTLRGGWGRISLSSQAETTIPAVNEWVKAAGETVLSPDAFTFVMPENGRLQCNCPVPSRMEVTAAINVINGNNKNFEVAIAKNGAILPETTRTLRIGPGGDVEEAVLLADFAQEAGDYAEVWIRNITDDTNATVTRLYMRARTYAS